jgi:hypothetical protein
MSSRSKAQNWPYTRYSQYRKVVEKAAADWFSNHDRTTKTKNPYILDSYANWTDNIILPEVADHIIKEKETALAHGHNFPLHKYIHHGLSSQALVFNLIGPMMISNDYTPLKRALDQVGADWPEGEVSAQFEYEDRLIFNEDSGQPTSVDVVFFDQEHQPRIFIESKFVEQKFGGCSVFAKGDCDGHNPIDDLDSCYLHFIGRRYWQLLGKYGFLDGKLAHDSSCALINHYQFFREILMALELNGQFVLMHDERSPVFAISNGTDKRGLFHFLMSITPEHLHKRIKIISIQQVVDQVEKQEDCSWISDFKEKYGFY